MAKGTFKFNWDELKTKIKTEEEKGRKNYKDDRYWNPDWKAKDRKGFWTIRFLPDTEGNPFVKYYSHGFKYTKDGAQKWYINNCISTFGWDPACPVCKKNGEYFNSPYESDKEIAKARKRRLNFVSNVLIVNDPVNPENNGTVRLFRYGSKIYEKIEKLLFPSDTDQEDPDFVQFIPFDLYEGANFKLKIKMQGEFPNYDDSEFSSQSPVLKGDDDKISELMTKTHALSEFLDPKNYPTVEKVIEEVGFLLGEVVSSGEDEEKETTTTTTTTSETENPFLSGDDETTEEETDTTTETSGGSGVDADMAFFKNLK